MVTALKYSWKQLYEELNACKECRLYATRTNVVPGEGNIHADIMFIGEGPGHDEDISGRPFVGAAGQLLNSMLESIKLTRDDVYIANIVKCRPPGNRTPEQSEALTCIKYLRAQTTLIKPGIIVCLGATAAKYVYSQDVRITRDRGVWINKKGVWILPTYHPAALLRDESKKQDAWSDFKSISEKLKQSSTIQ